ncbi:C-type lectin domain-containing protein [Caenorhabditis elegans]|uniref:C-type lectin domain-containing protein n=1 Tax=Caenorhabditis elegans TaxID=6239 RepID=O62025_CAEEL|nr:C-type lectin domain-containing protein [Caenorhabditis elegans]CAB03841.1 C-type lectin domain-containing protein [Caenorhabditis elegans]|eukprot:NP_497022.1 C-type LECtin [Caenorhabditis elegans]
MLRGTFILLISSLLAVEAFIRPSYYGGGGGYDEDCDCDTSSTVVVPTSTPTTTTEGPTTTLKLTTICLEGWTKYPRTPSASNNNQDAYCLKFISSNTTITINNASQICQQAGGHLTAFENEIERQAIMAEAGDHITKTIKSTIGAIALAGDRIKQCSTKNSTIIENPPCNDKTKVFTLPLTAQTNPEYLWTTWAQGEPSANWWEYDIEDCLQMFINPSNNTGASGRINDFYCNRLVAPNEPDNIRYMMYGALCGRDVEMEAAG